MGSDKRTRLEELTVAIIFVILLVVAICFSLDEINSTSAMMHPQHSFSVHNPG